MKQRFRWIPALRAWAIVLVLAGCSAPSQETSLSALHYFNKGNAAFMAEDYARAINHYRRAIAFDESAADIHYNLGLAFYRVNSYRQAIGALQKAVTLDPDFPEAHHNLALAYNKTYDMESANLHFNRYRSLVAGTGGGAGGGKNAGSQALKTKGGPRATAITGTKKTSTGKARNTAFQRKTNPPRKAAPVVPSAAGKDGMAAIQPATASAKRRNTGNPPAGNRSTELRSGTRNQSSSSNPFQGNGKWWTQDLAKPNQ